MVLSFLWTCVGYVATKACYLCEVLTELACQRVCIAANDVIISFDHRPNHPSFAQLCIQEIYE